MDHGAAWRQAPLRTKGWHWVGPEVAHGFDVDKWCDADMDVLMVGDSLMLQTYYALLAQLGAIDVIPRPTPSDQNTSHVVCGGKSRIHFVRNVWLLQNERPVPTRGHTVLVPWAHLLDKFDVVLVNQGAHVLPAPEYERNVRGALRLLAGSRGRGFFLGMPPGYPHCELYGAPTAPPDLTHAPYRWEVIPLRNEVTRGWTRGLPVGYIDLATMAMLRGDAHVGPQDCLHYVMPGVHDWWALVLYNKILF
jgi:hypothetical protein